LEREVEQLHAQATQYRRGFGGGKVYGRAQQSVNTSLTSYCGGKGAPTSKRSGDSSGSHRGSSFGPKNPRASSSTTIKVLKASLS